MSRIEFIDFKPIHDVNVGIVCSDEIRNEIKALKKEYKSEKKSREVKDEPADKKEKEKETDNEMVQNYLSEQRKYSHLKKDLPKKGAQRYCLIKSCNLIVFKLKCYIY